MALGLIPDFYFDVQLQPLVNPKPPQLGLVMVDQSPLGCVGCSAQAGPVGQVVGRVMVDESPLGLTTGGLTMIGLVLGAVAGSGLGYLLYRRRRRR